MTHDYANEAMCKLHQVNAILGLLEDHDEPGTEMHCIASTLKSKVTEAIDILDTGST